jgi:hypothetical protein
MPENINEWIGRHKVWLLTAAVLLGLFFRIHNLNSVGFAEDEVNKINAVRSYLDGDFTANAEHPMLMKSLILVSVVAADDYNRWIAVPRGWRPLSEEVAVRLPNVLVGAFTALAIYLVGSLYFNRLVGLLAAFLWATGINSIIINRVAKEDTLLVFFILLGFYFHRRMKLSPDSEPRRKWAFYMLSAVAMGLMLASKYFPHYAGLLLLYFYLHRRTQPAGYPPDEYDWRHLLRYLAVFVLVFLLFNPMILNPEVIRYDFSYSEQQTVTHHGYPMMGHLYGNNVSDTPLGGTPWYFYLLYLAVKVPPAVLIALVLGILLCARRWRDAGPFLVLFWLVFWLVPYSSFGVKFMRYSLTLMPALYLAAAVGLEAACVAAVKALRRFRLSLEHGVVAAVVPLIVLLPALGVLVAANPFYSLYVNRFGGGMTRVGWYFPHDEYYDLILREAIRRAVAQAPPDAVFAGETPAVFHYYLSRYKRPDIRVVNLSDLAFPVWQGDRVYVFLQPGRVYFENVEYYRRLWKRPRAVVEILVLQRPAVRVQRLLGREFLEIAGQRDFIEANYN